MEDTIAEDERFDAEVLQIASTTEVAEITRKNANLKDFKNRSNFFKTKFHRAFWSRIEDAKNRQDVYKEDTFFSGIGGIGKTSTIIYYMLTCIKKKDYSVNYIDLEVIAKEDVDLEFFAKHAKDFRTDLASYTLFIDHVTIMNKHYIPKIKTILPEAFFILVETGFTASIWRNPVEFSKKYQLDKEEFTKIWSLTLKSGNLEHDKKSRDLLEKTEGVYSQFSKNTIMTPRVLQYIYSAMYIHNRSLAEAWISYMESQRKAIKEFCEEDHKVMEEFLIHTKSLLHLIPKDGEYILTLDQYMQVNVAINIFDAEFCIVTKEDLEKNERLLDLELEEGETYIKLCHLIPGLASDWKQCLQYNVKDTLEYENPSKLIEIMFQNGGARKAIETMLVDYQKERKTVIMPEAVGIIESVYETETVDSTSIAPTSSVCGEMGKYYDPDLITLSSVDTDFKYCEKNVARCALWMKKKMRKNFLLHPKVENLMGVDYFIFRDLSFQVRECSKARRQSTLPRRQNILYLVQVATGSSHRGDTIGRALNVVKDILGGENVIVHVVILISERKMKPYTLKKCKLENVSVINLCSDSLFSNIESSNKCLSKFLLHAAAATTGQ